MEQPRRPVWKSTSELGYPEDVAGDLRGPPRHRADAATEARRVDGVRRPKFDFHTDVDPSPSVTLWRFDAVESLRRPASQHPRNTPSAVGQQTPMRFEHTGCALQDASSCGRLDVAIGAVVVVLVVEPWSFRDWTDAIVKDEPASRAIVIKGEPLAKWAFASPNLKEAVSSSYETNSGFSNFSVFTMRSATKASTTLSLVIDR